MTITEQVQIAADYDTWKREQVRQGGDHSVEAYERHLRSERNEIRLEQIHTLAHTAVTAPGNPDELFATLQQITNLSDPNEETQ